MALMECLAPEQYNTALLRLSQFIADNWSACRFPLEIWEEHDWDRSGRGGFEFWSCMPAIFGVNYGWEELERRKAAAISNVLFRSTASDDDETYRYPIQPT
ncbi:hypothetical protein K438DRAFT_1972074 [Mycena galopus ATCC 62051]|nr:hypothetical protein K438DRAFT_1972074 [Mycena galopus ATCC 62051]